MNVRMRTGMLAGGALLLALAGCGGPSAFVNPEADLPFYQKVAIIPFTSLSQDRVAGYRVSDTFFSELLRRGFADVVEPGQFSAAVVKLRGGTPVDNPWSAEELARLSEELGIEGIFLGTVREYEMSRTGRSSFPMLSLEVRLVDAASGKLVWSASTTRRGGPGIPVVSWFLGLFGGGEIHTMGELTTAVCRDFLKTLPRN
jgi:TolB-like protein